MNTARETDRAIQTAIRREACESVPADVRWDLAQDLALQLSKMNKPPSNLPAWIKRSAKFRVADWLRTERVHRELLKALHEGRKVSARQRPTERQPEWHETREGRVRCCRNPMVWEITVKPSQHGSGVNETEDAIIGAVDSRARSGKGPKRAIPRT